jgi:hypothetical protein
MDAHAVQQWERSKALATSLDVTWRVKDAIELYDKRGLTLGRFATVAETFAFLCGYEHRTR